MHSCRQTPPYLHVSPRRSEAGLLPSTPSAQPTNGGDQFMVPATPMPLPSTHEEDARTNTSPTDNDGARAGIARTHSGDSVEVRGFPFRLSVSGLFCIRSACGAQDSRDGRGEPHAGPAACVCARVCVRARTHCIHPRFAPARASFGGELEHTWERQCIFTRSHNTSAEKPESREARPPHLPAALSLSL